MIRTVSIRTKASALMLKEIVIPNSSVIRFASSFCAVSDMDCSTPHSRIRFPNIRKPTRATDAGEIRPTIIVTIIGKAIFVVLETAFGLYVIWMRRSFLVVTRRIANGWIIGTRAI